MYSKILIKLVDEAVLPALILLSARIISIVLVSSYFDIPFTIGEGGFVFRNSQQYVFVNSYSVLSMVAVLTVGLLYILYKAFVLHETHITPGRTAKLFSMKLSSFIQSSFDLYSQGVIWLSYSFLMLFVSAVLVIFNLLYAWVFFTALIFSIIATLLFVLDIEREVFAKHKTPAAEDVQEEFVLTLGSLE